MNWDILNRNYKILQFYLKTYPVIREVMKTEIGFESSDDEKNEDIVSPLKISFNKQLVDNYNDEFKKFSKELNQEKPLNEIIGNCKVEVFFILRLICCVLSIMDFSYISLGLNMLQFIILPYSLISSILFGLEINYHVFLGYYIYIFIALFVKKIIFNWENYKYLNFCIEVDNTLICIYFLCDLLLSLKLIFYNSNGKTEKITLKRLFQSFIFGALNSKSYFILLFFYCKGTQLSLFIWILDLVFDISNKLHGYFKRNNSKEWHTKFYHSHRIVHLPHVYSDAHKFHHYFHGTNPFEAHLFGIGAPEEWLILMSEILFVSIFKLFPPSLSSKVLEDSYYNKISHTRIEEGGESEIFHTDHHIYALKNYGVGGSMDMLFGTATKNDVMDGDDFLITKSIENDKIILVYEEKKDS